MDKKRGNPIDYKDASVRQEILVRQRRNMWTPEQIASLARHFRLRPGLSMLDAGCGMGYCLTTWGPFCQPGGKLVGLDIEATLFPAARRQTRKAGLRGAKFVAGDISALPFADNEFDFTIEQIVLSHLPDAEKALAEMIRVTRRGGCVVAIDNAATGFGATSGNNCGNPPIADRLLDYEMGLRMHNGQRKLAQGDFSVGCKIPGWMERHGLVDIDIRRNETVHWAVPPYRSERQRTEVEVVRARLELIARQDPRYLRIDNRMLQAGGATDDQIRRNRGNTKQECRVWLKGLADGTAEWVSSISSLICIWGFKPR